MEDGAISDCRLPIADCGWRRLGTGWNQLPGVLDAFMQWCEQTREDFQLGRQIEAQLDQRRYPIGVTFRYREWRQLAQEDAVKVAALGFQDDPTKAGHNALRLEGEGRPG
jgi:hypothetical protein